MGWRRVTVIIVLLGLSLSVPAGVIGWAVYIINKPLQIEHPPVAIDVAEGSSLNSVAQRLEDKGWASPSISFFMRLYSRITGLAGNIKAGEYTLYEGISARQFLARMIAGEVTQYRLTVIEGWTFDRLITALREHDKIEFTLEDVDTTEIMDRLGLEGRHPEGMFYPTTYNFPKGTTDRQFLRNAYAEMRQRLEEIWQTRQVGLPLETPYEALILASIIEREAQVEKERAKIAGVFVRRLNKGMRLQADPTVIYGMDKEKNAERITRADLRRDTSYNTYTRHGLPPTPIALPGSASIKAAVNPEPGDELYFVSRGDGTHHFSATLEEHNAAVKKYILGNR